MSNITTKCTETGPANVGWCVGRCVLRKAATPLWLCKCLYFSGFIVSPLVFSVSKQTPRTIPFHFNSFYLWATNTPIYGSGLSGYQL